MFAIRLRLQCQVFLRMHPNPFMDEVGIEYVDQGDIGIEVSGWAHSAMTWALKDLE